MNCSRCKIREKQNNGNGYCKECNKIVCKTWYEKNRIDKINKTKEHQKKTNYSSEKTNLQKFIRNIKRLTRYYFPLEGHNCEFCGEKATEHHHTNPIEIDKFNYACHRCHIDLNK